MSDQDGEYLEDLELLHRLNPKCYYCGVKTIYRNPPSDDYRNKASREHLYDAFDRRRYVRYNRYLIALACCECNHKRGRIRLESMPRDIKAFFSMTSRKDKKNLPASFYFHILAGLEDNNFI